MKQPDNTMTVTEAAALAGVTLSGMRRAIAEGRVRTIVVRGVTKFGDRHFIPIDEAERYANLPPVSPRGVKRNKRGGGL